MPIKWLTTAHRNLDHHAAHIAKDKPDAARRAVERVRAPVDRNTSARYKSTAHRSLSGASDRGRDGEANFNRDIARHRPAGRGTNGRSTLSHGLRSQFRKGSGALVAGC